MNVGVSIHDKDPKRHYAWMVIVDKAKGGPVFPDHVEGEVPSTRRASRPPRMASDTLGWQFDDVHDGFSTTDVEVYPVPGNRDDALEWWKTNGKKIPAEWIVNRFLISIVDYGNAKPLPQGRDPGKPDHGEPVFKPPFEPAAWGPGQWERDRQGGEGALPANWWQSLKRPQVIDPAKDCADVQLAIGQRPANTSEIEWQAKTLRNSLAPLLSVLGNVDGAAYKTATLELLHATDAHLNKPLFLLKKRFARQRPQAGCKDVDSLFPQGHPLYPGHPSFPSGHAALAYAAAFLLGEALAVKHPGIDARLLIAAEAVAQNRVIAGVHYPSDSIAGKELARWMVQAVKDRKPFADLMRAVAAEW